MDVLRRMTSDFREPVIWLVLAIVARGVVEIIAFVLLDQDLVKHDRAEVGVEYELSVIFGRFGQAVPAPDQARVKGQDNYVGRIVATIVIVRHLPVLVVLQPDDRAEPPLPDQLGRRGRPGGGGQRPALTGRPGSLLPEPADQPGSE